MAARILLAVEEGHPGEHTSRAGGAPRRAGRAHEQRWGDGQGSACRGAKGVSDPLARAPLAAPPGPLGESRYKITARDRCMESLLVYKLCVDPLTLGQYPIVTPAAES